MSEITTTKKGHRKKQQLKKWVSENQANGKLGNEKWASRKKGNTN